MQAQVENYNEKARSASSGPIVSQAPTASEPQAQQKQEAQAPKVPGIQEQRVQLGEYFVRTFKVTSPAGTPMEALLGAEYWAHVAYKFEPGDVLYCHVDDMRWFALLYVRDVGSKIGGSRLPNWAKVDVLLHREFGTYKRGPNEHSHEVKFLGPQQKWCVVRAADQSIVFSGFGTQEDAIAKMSGYTRAMAS